MKQEIKTKKKSIFHRILYTVGDRIGGICDFGNANFLTMGDMVLILETDMDPKGFFEWSAANEENKDYISLHCWLQGVRHSDFYGK